MPGNDERDPLDSWLRQQVDPLPPPPGTFELITRRARRRKLRRLAATVASAAAVAAGVAVAVPNVVALNVKPSHESANSVAQGRSPSPRHSTQQTNGSASPLPPARPMSPNPSPFTEPNGPVPANFQPSSVTFVNQDTGWVIGQAGTPGQCHNPNPDICTSIARTDDAGKTWHGGPAPDTTGPNGPNGVSGIRFLDGENGWAFGPELWVTHDAGNTWHQIDTGGQRVTDLEAAGNRAYALFATCSGTNADSFASGCTSFTLMTTLAGSDNWTQAGAPTNGLTNGGNPASAVLGLTGSVGYLLAPDGTLYSGPLGGTWTRAGTAPCKPGTAQASGLPGDAWLALVDSAHLAIACQGTAASALPLYTSGNGGASWTQLTSLGASGISDFGTAMSLAAAPDGTLVLATTHGLYVRPAGDSQWKTVANVPSQGFTYVGMTADAQGVAVPADTSLHQVWMTFDGGLTWAPRAAITPGN